MINNVHLSPNTPSERATGQLDRPCLMCVGMANMLAHRRRATTVTATLTPTTFAQRDERDQCAADRERDD
jgi:hypothetical protein